MPQGDVDVGQRCRQRPNSYWQSSVAVNGRVLDMPNCSVVPALGRAATESMQMRKLRSHAAGQDAAGDSASRRGDGSAGSPVSTRSAAGPERVAGALPVTAGPGPGVADGAEDGAPEGEEHAAKVTAVTTITASRRNIWTPVSLFLGAARCYARIVTPPCFPRPSPQYDGKTLRKGTPQMSPQPNDRPPRRRGTTVLFVGLLLAGLAVLALRMVAAPGVSGLEMVLPILGGVLIAAAIAVIVVRERRDRRHMTPAERDRQDQGVPR